MKDLLLANFDFSWQVFILLTGLFITLLSQSIYDFLEESFLRKWNSKRIFFGIMIVVTFIGSLFMLNEMHKMFVDKKFEMNIRNTNNHR